MPAMNRPNPSALLLSLAAVASVSLSLAALGRAASPPPAGPARAAATAELATDPGWPREITKDGLKFVYYEPQIDEWKNQRELRMRIAFSLTPSRCAIARLLIPWLFSSSMLRRRCPEIRRRPRRQPSSRPSAAIPPCT